MKNILYILLLFSLTASCQGFDMTYFLADMQDGWSIGNACNEPYMVSEVNGNFNMNGNTLEVMRSHIIVYGIVENEGTIIYKCDDSILEIRGETLTIEDVDYSQLKIYPNPVIDEINIKGVQVSKLELYDVYGRLLKHYQTFGSLHKIKIDELSAGIYFLKINDTVTKKIVKR